MNRFFDIDGDVSTQLAPWALKAIGCPIDVARYRLFDDLWFRSDRAGGILLVKAGTISDLASLPRFLWSSFMSPSDPRIALGAWFHDDCYARRGIVSLYRDRDRDSLIRGVQLTREDCDYILAYEAMPELGASKAQSWLVYNNLRWFGDRWT